MYRFLILFVLAAPTITLGAPRTFAELMDSFTVIINAGIGVALILGVVLYFYGIVSHYAQSVDKPSDKYKTQILWGLIALFVMFSVWGILALLRNTLFGGGEENFDSGSGFSEETICTSLEDCVIPE